jgi:hypothetical protein
MGAPLVLAEPIRMAWLIRSNPVMLAADIAAAAAADADDSTASVVATIDDDVI